MKRRRHNWNALVIANSKILYEVVIAVAPEARENYLAWLTPHMDAMLNFDGVQSAELLFNSEDQNEITCHYMDRINKILTLKICVILENET